MLGSVQEEIKITFAASIAVSTDQMLSIMRSLLLPPSNAAVSGLSLCRELLLGLALVSWACLRWSFGLTTKGLHFPIAADSAERIYQTWGACALQDRSGQVTTAVREGWLRLSETWSKHLKSKSIHGPHYVFLTFLSCISSPKWNYSFSSFCSILWKALQRRNGWIWNSSPQFQIFS